VCKKIEIGNLKEKVEILRGDEIGVLANSFNHMIDQINTSTDQLIEVTKFNEDILKNIYIGIMTTDNNGKMATINMAGKEIFQIRRGGSSQ
jgi:two-component system phosphate regulon sensor histidine kinase PhoR